MTKRNTFHEALDHLSPEEVHALIDFNESMAHDAYDSGEYAEEQERTARAKALKAYLFPKGVTVVDLAEPKAMHFKLKNLLGE